MALPAIASDFPLAASLRRHAEAARGAYSRNTEEALRGDIALWTRWCDQVRQASLPASPESITIPPISRVASARAPAREASAFGAPGAARTPAEGS